MLGIKGLTTAAPPADVNPYGVRTYDYFGYFGFLLKMVVDI